MRRYPLGYFAVERAAKRGYTTYGLAGCSQLRAALGEVQRTRRSAVADDIVTVEVCIDPSTPPPLVETWVDHGDHVHRVVAGLRLGPSRRPEKVAEARSLFCERPRPERWPGTAVLIMPPEDPCAS